MKSLIPYIYGSVLRHIVHSRSMAITSSPVLLGRYELLMVAQSSDGDSEYYLDNGIYCAPYFVYSFAFGYKLPYLMIYIDDYCSLCHKIASWFPYAIKCVMFKTTVY